MDAGAQFLGVEGFGQVIVGTGLEAAHKIVALAACGEQEQIHVWPAGILSDALAYLNAFEAGHHPVENGYTGRVAAFEKPNRFQSVLRNDNFVSPFFQQRLEKPARHRIVFRDENFFFRLFFFGHRTCSPMRAG